MKQLNQYHALSLVILAMLANDCQSSGTGHLPAILEPTVTTTYPTVFPTQMTNESIKDSSAKSAAHDSAVKLAKINSFVRTNLSNLTNDMAKGKGQYLSNLAEMLDIPPAKKDAFYTVTKNNFTELMPDSDTSAEELVSGFFSEQEAMESQGPYPQPIDFIRLKWEDLIADMAKGRGFYLTAIADMLAIPIEKRAAFYAITKNKLPQLVPAGFKANFAEDLLQKFRNEAANNLSKPIVITPSTSKPIQSQTQKRFDIPHQNLVLFVREVKFNLMSEMKGWAGNHLLKKMAVLLNVPFEKRPLFYTVSQNKVSQLIPNDEITPEQLLGKLEAEAAKL